MDMQEDPGLLFRAGQLEPAVAAATQAVRRAPTDAGARLLLAELLLFTGNLERADTLLDAAATADPSAAVGVAEFRHLLRAEMARRQVVQDGRVPEFIGEPTPALRALLAAKVALRSGDGAEAARLVLEAETVRPRVAGRTDGRAFADWRDLDDLSAGLLEVLTTTGKYFWIPTETIMELRFHPPARPRDLAWRRANISIAGGRDGDVYVPVLYASERDGLSDALRLGRATEWIEDPAGLMRGLGQRCFLIDDDGVGIMDLTELRFDAP
jgi:type VI secretion system protein ImpE